MKAIGFTTIAQKSAAPALFLVLGLAASFGQAPPKVSFVGRMDYAVGLDPQGIVVGDLNSDGNLDLVTVSGLSTAGTVSVLLGNADGTFQPAANYTVPSNSTIVQLGDFNGDGKLDILVASQPASPPASLVSVSVLLGNGDGTFQAQKVTSTAGANCTIAITFTPAASGRGVRLSMSPTIRPIAGLGPGGYRHFPGFFEPAVDLVLAARPTNSSAAVCLFLRRHFDQPQLRTVFQRHTGRDIYGDRDG